MPNPEQLARQEVDRLLTAAGWAVQHMAEANLHAARGVALREFPLQSGFGFADYLLYVDGRTEKISAITPFSLIPTQGVVLLNPRQP